MGYDFGHELDVRVHVDASAAIGVAQRKGLGKIRQLDTQSLRIQDADRSRRVSLLKVPGSENPPDCMTKHLDSGLQPKDDGQDGVGGLGRPCGSSSAGVTGRIH